MSALNCPLIRRILTLAHIYIYIYTNKHIYVYIYMYIHMHIYIYMESGIVEWFIGVGFPRIRGTIWGSLQSGCICVEVYTGAPLFGEFSNHIYIYTHIYQDPPSTLRQGYKAPNST